MTPEIMDAIKVLLEGLMPDYQGEHTKLYVEQLINIAYSIAKNDGFTDDKLTLATAYLVLDLLSNPTMTGTANVASRQIEGVSETYVDGAFTVTAWKNLYDMLLNGLYATEYTLHYVGIS